MANQECECGNDVTPNDEDLPLCEECLLDYNDNLDYDEACCNNWE